MVWGGIIIEGRRHTDLYVMHGRSLTALRYRDKILRLIVLLYAGAVGGAFILMTSNEGP